VFQAALQIGRCNKCGIVSHARLPCRERLGKQRRALHAFPVRVRSIGSFGRPWWSGQPSSRRSLCGGVRIILSAFVADPAARWMYPEESEYQTYFLAFVRAFAGAAFLTGSAHVVGSGSGAALWLPPGNHPDDHELAGLIGRSVPAWRRGAVFSVFEEMGRYHPLDPHWHLPLIGVEPSEHRRARARNRRRLTSNTPKVA
jgi:hypothetical protein